MSRINNDDFESLKNLKESMEMQAEPSRQVHKQQEFETGITFVTPVDIVDLPTKGKFYSQGSSLYGRSSIEIRHMTTKDEDILTNKSLIKKGIVIDKLLESLVVDKSINIYELLSVDRNAVLVAARVSAYGPQYPVSITCPACSSKESIEIDLQEYLNKDYEKTDDELLSKEQYAYERMSNGNVMVKLPKTNWFVELKPLNGRDEKNLAQKLEAKKKFSSQDGANISDQLSLIIESINTVSDRFQIEKAINMMPAADSKRLRFIYQTLFSYMNMKFNFNCEECKLEEELEVPFTQEFFWPSR